MKPRQKPPRGRGHARQLDRAQILDAARALARRQKDASVTMRAIARELDVDVAALYWHFENKAALLDALSEQATGQAPLVVPERDEWCERTRELCRAIRARLRERPELGLARSSAFGPFTAHCVATTCRALDGCGLAGRARIFAAQTLVQTVLGVVATESAQARSSPSDGRDYAVGLARQLPDDLAESWLDVTLTNPEESFERLFEDGIDLVLSGVGVRGGANATLVLESHRK